MTAPQTSSEFTATQREPAESAIGYEDYVIWKDGRPVGCVSLKAGEGTQELAVEKYLERKVDADVVVVDNHPPGRSLQDSIRTQS